MSLFRRPTMGLSVAVVVAAIAAVVGAFAPPAYAFQIQNHERVTRDALTPVGVDPPHWARSSSVPRREPVRSAATRSSPMSSATWTTPPRRSTSAHAPNGRGTSSPR